MKHIALPWAKAALCQTISLPRWSASSLLLMELASASTDAAIGDGADDAQEVGRRVRHESNPTWKWNSSLYFDFCLCAKLEPDFTHLTCCLACVYTPDVLAALHDRLHEILNPGVICGSVLTIGNDHFSYFVLTNNSNPLQSTQQQKKVQMFRSRNVPMATKWKTRWCSFFEQTKISSPSLIRTCTLTRLIRDEIQILPACVLWHLAAYKALCKKQTTQTCNNYVIWALNWLCLLLFRRGRQKTQTKGKAFFLLQWLWSLIGALCWLMKQN